MVSAETKEFLESGCALVLATVSSDGAPFASRGWGLDFLSPDGDRVQLLLDIADVTAIDNLEQTGRIAVTATNVPTLHSMQMKGRYVRMLDVDDDDRARADRYCDAFFDDIERTDGTDRPRLERLRPTDYVVCELVIEEFFDQTPGPGAGASLVRP